MVTVAGTKTCKLENLKFQIDYHDLSFFKIYDNSREAHSACFYWSESYFNPPNGYPKVEISSVFLKIHVFGSKIRMSPKVDRVWGDPKSKFCPKTPFLKRKQLDQIFTKNLKTFQKKLLKFWSSKKKSQFFFGIR